MLVHVIFVNSEQIFTYWAIDAVSINLSANFAKSPNRLKQFVGNLPTNCVSVFGHFEGLALKGLISNMKHIFH